MGVFVSSVRMLISNEYIHITGSGMVEDQGAFENITPVLLIRKNPEVSENARGFSRYA